ncbi:unnamed protein product [Taenia asiatica]|uniref:WGS project CAEQ00000000 data, annotated contig n=1 Tax=Taenia asiatica TaxID=60517 RepID=A0A0R3WEL1_TAEAS|nr:unnamed protein product [Taenia asiatica]
MYTVALRDSLWPRQKIRSLCHLCALFDVVIAERLRRFVVSTPLCIGLNALQVHLPFDGLNSFTHSLVVFNVFNTHATLVRSIFCMHARSEPNIFSILVYSILVFVFKLMVQMHFRHTSSLCLLPCHPYARVPVHLVSVRHFRFFHVFPKHVSLLLLVFFTPIRILLSVFQTQSFLFLLASFFMLFLFLHGLYVHTEKHVYLNCDSCDDSYNHNEAYVCPDIYSRQNYHNLNEEHACSDFYIRHNYHNHK